MAVIREEIGDVILLRMDGRTTLGIIKEMVNEQVDRGSKKIVVDLRGVSFIDSTGLGELVASYAIAKRSGGVIKLVSDTEKMGHILDITRISSIFDVHATSEDAVSSF